MIKSICAGAALASFALASPAFAQAVKPFGPTAVPCNSEGFSNCRVSVNGSTATRTYLHVRGGQTTAVHSGCTAKGNVISCLPGKWTTDKGFSGNNDTLTITLDGAGKAKSTGH